MRPSGCTLTLHGFPNSPPRAFGSGRQNGRALAWLRAGKYQGSNAAYAVPGRHAAKLDLQRLLNF